MPGFVDVIFRVNNAAVKTGFEQMKQGAARLKTDIASQFAGAFAVGAIVGTLKAAADEFGRVRDLSERFGESAESVQRVGFAAKQSGADIEIIAKSLSKATQNASDAAAGNEKLAAAFEQLGINADEFVNMSMEDKLVAISAGLETVQGDSNKLVLALDVLGKSGGDLLPLLKQGPDALRESMAAATVATQAEIEALDDLADRLDATGGKVRVVLGGAFVWLAERVEDAGSYIGAVLSYTMERLEKAGGLISKLVSGDLKGAASAAKELVSSEMGGFGRIQEIAGAEIDARAAAREEKSNRRPAGLSLPTEEDEAPPPTEDAAAAKQAAAEAKAAESAQAKADSERLAKEERILSLREKIADQEFQKLTPMQKLATLANDANNLMVDRGEDEEGRLARLVDLNETQAEIAKLEEERTRAAEDVVKAGFQRRQDALGFASGQAATSVDSGLLGVNAKVGAVEAQKSIELQQEMTAYLKTLAEKEWAVVIPEME